MKTKAIYAGSFDPIHLGHLDIIRRAAKIFDLTILVSHNPFKKYFFDNIERLNLVKESVNSIDGVRVKLLPDKVMVVDYAYENDIGILIRGVRNFGDYDTEKMLRDVNVGIQNGIETIFLSSDSKLAHISSTAVKELYKYSGFVHEYVPLCVKEKMEANNNRFVIGVTGNIASGKNWLCKNLCSQMWCEHIDLDELGHNILFKSDLLIHQKVRKEIRHNFDIKSLDVNGSSILSETERTNLGNIVFGDSDKRDLLNSIMYQPILTELRKSISALEGIILLNGALLVEFGLTHICNNNVIVVTTNDELRIKRLKERGLTDEQIKHRLESQYTDKKKIECLNKEIEKSEHGSVVLFDNIIDKAELNDSDINGLIEWIMNLTK